ncbi:uncharacterized protein LOC118923037 isoform X3 [Manis pentadactyla]|uniref:uncharacterized protein LOC118923037 isoform X3 n=1 Tax=Manis pentadactyla TaxID=143292 RepID=UPI00255C811E|nr:uncharacterized protein LOC118923037 isoform X3 [Manis pentadactyla]XP_057358355.1 uncharacterized protein LOC118923037 isoform X3 [Manis pentadactyla]
MRRTLLSATVPLLKAVSGMCVTFTALLNDRPLENTKNEGQLGKSKSHSRVVLKSSTKQKTTVFSTRASEKSSSDCKKNNSTNSYELAGETQKTLDLFQVLFLLLIRLHQGTAMETFNVQQHNSSLLYEPSD